jgi:hypothetical protein
VTDIPTWVIGAVALGFIGGLLVVVRIARRRARLSYERTDEEHGSACESCGQSLPPVSTECPSCGHRPPAPIGAIAFTEGPLEGQVFQLTQDVTTLGQAAGSSIVLVDPTVAKKHVGIRRDPSGYELADLGSEGGVLVNGHRVAKRMLAAGDVIRIGTSEMVFRMEKVG